MPYLIIITSIFQVPSRQVAEKSKELILKDVDDTFVKIQEVKK